MTDPQGIDQLPSLFRPFARWLLDQVDRTHILRQLGGGRFIPGADIRGNLDANARVGVRKNSAGSTYLRRRINVIEGSGISVTLADDATDEEVDVTLTATRSGVKLSDIETYHRFIISAHRGDINAVDGYPENTLAACRAAARKGAHRVEVDPALSADGTWYLMHDATVDRTTDGSGNVSAKTDAEMDALTIDAGYGYRSTHAGLYHPPTLLSVMNALAPYDVTVQLDQMATEAEGTAMATYVVAQGWTERVVITCMTQAIAQAVKAVESRIAVMGPAGETGWAELDVCQWSYAAMPTEATILGIAPRKASIWIPIETYSTADVPAITREVYNAGARYLTTHDIGAALQVWREMSGPSTRWEPVCDVSGSVLVDISGNPVMARVPVEV